MCKLGWWKEGSWDVRAYAAGHPRFPNDSTGRQLYDAGEFEAHRALGHEAAAALIRQSDLGHEARTIG
ncbi:hypothetical protein [Actinoplanes sp. NPDC049316]|uniref:hypothetical protein n=1 Tax=Actinoplanes sp. NPDC049316 TaxID=3154727 RepID=UPI00343B89DE